MNICPIILTDRALVPFMLAVTKHGKAPSQWSNKSNE